MVEADVAEPSDRTTALAHELCVLFFRPAVAWRYEVMLMNNGEMIPDTWDELKIGRLLFLFHGAKGLTPRLHSTFAGSQHRSAVSRSWLWYRSPSHLIGLSAPLLIPCEAAQLGRQQQRKQGIGSTSVFTLPLPPSLSQKQQTAPLQICERLASCVTTQHETKSHAMCPSKKSKRSLENTMTRAANVAACGRSEV